MKFLGDPDLGEARIADSPAYLAGQHIKRTYPNGTLATSAGALGTVIIWVSTNVFTLPMDATAGAAFATVFAGVASFVGRRGIKGFFTMIWHGSRDEED